MPRRAVPKPDPEPPPQETTAKRGLTIRLSDAHADQVRRLAEAAGEPVGAILGLLETELAEHLGESGFFGAWERQRRAQEARVAGAWERQRRAQEARVAEQLRLAAPEGERIATIDEAQFMKT